ncbi:MAG: adenylate/guanylate cyclase domain-containing protein [Burkholderiales bacterium]
MLSRERPFRVVVVGNDEPIHTLVRDHLDGSGVVVESAQRCEDVLQLMENQTPDLVVVEPGGRGLSGFDLCRLLKNDPDTALLPVVVLSDSAERRLEGFSVGVDEFMTRDVTREEFLVRVNALLRVSSTRRTLAASRLEVEIQRREEIGDTFRRYVSASLVDQILSDSSLRHTALADRNMRVRAAVLFADMRGFTRISEQIPPMEVVPLLNDYFSLLTQITFQHQGTVFNMAGDCLMVGFGVPLEQHDASVRAVEAAREMLSRFRDLAQDWKRRLGIETGLGIGINEGEVIAGNIGSQAYMSYTIIGDTVNVASRLGQRARAGEMLFSESVKQSLEQARVNVVPLPLPPLVLRGRSQPVEIYCVPVDERLDIRPA